MRKVVGKLVDEGGTVTVVMHSYGGQVGTNALYDMGIESRARQNLSGGVSHLIYMCAFALPENGSMVKKVEVRKYHSHRPLFIIFNGHQMGTFTDFLRILGNGRWTSYAYCI